MTGPVSAGIYSGHSDTTSAIDGAISASASFAEWANAIDASRSMTATGGSSSISTTGVNSLGDLDAAAIAAGDAPGFLTVQFPTGVRNGSGADFAVFENAFPFMDNASTTEDESVFLFAELAYVEVSTNGQDFLRFPSVSTNSEEDLFTPFGRSFAGLDPSNVFNLAGKHNSGFGTPFDLDDLQSDSLVTSGLVDLNDIQFVKLVDVPGNGDFLDSQGNGILDAWLTTGASAGFDFRLPAGQGIGVINAVGVPEPGTAGVICFAVTLVVQRRRRKVLRGLA